MSTMIALIGEQPLPNYLPILHEKPDSVVLVYTTTTQPTYENLKGVLTAQKFVVYGIKIDPYDITTITTTLETELAKLPAQVTQSFVFNLTGGTKTMSLAAYQIAAQRCSSVIYLQSEKGKSIIERYDWEEQRLRLQQQVKLPEYLHLQDMLQLHLGPDKDVNGKTIWKVAKPTEQKDTYGHLFELAIAQALRDDGYEVLCSVKGKGDQLDIDVLVEYQNQIGIIEAKTSKDGTVTELLGLKQLSTTMNYIRGTYVKQFLVIAGQPSPDLKEMSKLLRVKVIPLPDYKRGPAAISLSQHSRETLLQAINEVMKIA